MRRSRRLALWIGIVFGILLAFLAAYEVFGAQPPPKQPIPFSHLIHAENLKIACVYCHEGVTHRATAGIPSEEKCINCHKTVTTNDPQMTKLIAEVQSYWNAKKPIIWARVAYLPDHVYFTHQFHIRAGFNCATCHGQIDPNTGSFARFQPGMSFCLDCHRRYNAPTDCWTCHK